MFDKFKKKRVGGFLPKKRTHAEIDREYADHAIQRGHKLRVMDDLQREVEQHAKRMTELHQERLATPPDEPTPKPTAAPDTATEGTAA